jgi:L-seryl-tRNA(Ser) seleniumtransferase
MSTTESASGDRPRRLPSIGGLLATPAAVELVQTWGRPATVEALRAAVEALRSGESADDPVALAEHSLLARFGGRTRQVLNATGVLLHTNLGRAPLPRLVIDDIVRVGFGACDLELDLDTNRRSERLRRVATRLQLLTEAEAALVANNAAAALVLAVAALAAGREVVVSRGQLVEIGGSFRIPEILGAAGGRLVEVGSTNRTRIGDYRRALSSETAMILEVFRSNFEVSGFVEQVETRALAELAHQHGVPLVVDEGSGLLGPSPAAALKGKTSIRELIAAGADLVIGSGDKVLGGPQAGLMVGRAALIERCRTHPLYRALRPGKTTLVALEAVVSAHMAGRLEDPARALEPTPDLLVRVEGAAARLGATIGEGRAELGGGAGAAAGIAGPVIELAGSEALAKRLRLGRPAVLGYLRGDRLILDLRTVDAADDEALVSAVLQALEET